VNAMTSSNDGPVQDPHGERPDPTQELWSAGTAEQPPATDATQELAVDEATPATAGDPTPTSQPTTASDPVDRGPVGSDPVGNDPVAASEPATTEPAAWPPPVPPRPTGPHLPAILLGLLCLVVAGVVLAQELGNLTIDWGNVGPLGFVAVGAVLVLLGIVGLAGSNRRNARS